MTRILTLLFAFAGGLAVGNLYWAQPLLDFIAHDLHTSPAAAGWLVTATQIGYALGIVLIVPLGDILNRRRLIPVMMLCSAAALAACAAAPSFLALAAAITLLGMTTVAGQLLTPLAGDLADDAHRGAVVGTVVSGLLTGILVSRTVSGLVAAYAGWRTIFATAAIAAVLVAALLYRAIPPVPPKTRMSYPALIASVGRTVRQEPAVRWTLALGASGFAMFTMFWTALTFLLSGEPFSYPVSVIGLFGLAGLAGALAAQRAGLLHDRGWSLPATGAACALSLIAFGIAAAARASVLLVIVAIVVLDVAVQTLNLLNQARLFAVSHEARSRLNTAFVTGNFVGGAIGSAAAGLLWAHGGWNAVCTAGASLAVVALAVWALGRRGPLRTTAAASGAAS
ncbi:MFS transporter [Streptomyces arenae]|uniref:MFS transporter n=1 Tax=Streptomyces arenae TaxID=29301 RepID=UPI002659311F|nr:MFS transporter [Streptomyces arenae]MCG7210127.1 MFS transporter [Streptomyces arenae]